MAFRRGSGRVEKGTGNPFFVCVCALWCMLKTRRAFFSLGSGGVVTSRLHVYLLFCFFMHWLYSPDCCVFKTSFFEASGALRCVRLGRCQDRAAAFTSADPGWFCLSALSDSVIGLNLLHYFPDNVGVSWVETLKDDWCDGPLLPKCNRSIRWGSIENVYVPSTRLLASMGVDFFSIRAILPIKSRFDW